ncbi:hypothetical protein, partial [Escherichia coli]|uniref:hypothetical protein n=1 Tax=Escherichia coli TaxID=562 RepID=UPI0021E99626
IRPRLTAGFDESLSYRRSVATPFLSLLPFLIGMFVLHRETSPGVNHGEETIREKVIDQVIDLVINVCFLLLPDGEEARPERGKFCLQNLATSLTL